MARMSDPYLPTPLLVGRVRGRQYPTVSIPNYPNPCKVCREPLYDGIP